MVGGYVIDMNEHKDVVQLRVKDGFHSSDYCFVDISKEDSVKINLGDSVWWQHNLILWTPMGSSKKECGVDFDIKINKIGYSYGFSHD